MVKVEEENKPSGEVEEECTLNHIVKEMEVEVVEKEFVYSRSGGGAVVEKRVVVWGRWKWWRRRVYCTRGHMMEY